MKKANSGAWLRDSLFINALEGLLKILLSKTKYMDTFTKARHFECGRRNDTEMGGSVRAIKGSKG